MKKKNDIDYLAERAALRARNYDPSPEIVEAIRKWLKATPNKEDRKKYIRQIKQSLDN